MTVQGPVKKLHPTECHAGGLRSHTVNEGLWRKIALDSAIFDKVALIKLRHFRLKWGAYCLYRSPRTQRARCAESP